MRITWCLMLWVFSWTELNAQEHLRALVGARILQPDGTWLERGVVILQGGKIRDVGASLNIPPGAVIDDVEGRRLYPGLIDMGNNLGLSEIGSVRGSVDTSEKGLANPHLDVLSAVNPHSDHVGVARANGVLYSLTSPQGELLAGRPALIVHDGKTGREMAVSENTGILLNFPRIRRKDLTESSAARLSEIRSAALKRLNGYFDLARRHLAATAAATANPQLEAPPMDLALAALAPVLERKMPLIIVANDVDTIVSAVLWAEEKNVRMILRGARDAWKVADFLAEKKIDCILDSVFSQPGEEDAYDTCFAAPGVLFRAGVRIAFATSSSSDARNLSHHAAMAVAFGLDEAAAMRALTKDAADMLGAGELIGGIFKGARATLFVADGDILDPRTRVERVFIKGRDVGIESRHTRLRDEFGDVTPAR